MKDTLRWAYALNQWNVRLDVFVRHEDQQRALKTVSACGFDTIELASGTGRWDNISRPEVILLPTEPYHFTEADAADFIRLGEEIPAVRDHRIHVVEGELMSWYGPRVGRALREVSALLRLPR